ncbi:DUF488 domain-containing protein [Undibacterium sp. CY7W]|uniref:DUF488 domain-containing protein n=1 Tax=Undibacterium rugosum TaxID=2762291 RepID=A0A923I5Y2_9BURK|nr:DUF488 domain-containing protein [Undibacterium rugosum]MBC3936744.1 DUF488 domain-containing protein [Undibacterium rugosum]
MDDIGVVATIGFTEKSAEKFFSLLKTSNVKRVLDVRLNNTSQLSGFAKRDDLKYFLKTIANIDYVEIPDLMPDGGLLKDYRNKVIDWNYYESKYIELLDRRSAEKKLDKSIFEGGCLLCSEHKPHQCHRRIAIEYLNAKWDTPLPIKHLL